MTSSKKIASNQQNAGKSTGPKTRTGKKNTASNALQHGFYARELVISEQDKDEFESIRKALFAQLAPKTPLQTIAFEQIVSSSWRCKLAIRLEMHRLKSQFRTDEEHLSDKPGKVRDISEIRWYGASADDLNVAIKILKDLHADIADNGAIHLKEKKNVISRAFGPQFYDALMTWDVMSIDAILLAEHLVEHEKKFPRTPIASGRSAPTAEPAASTSGPTPSSPEPRPSTGAAKDQHSKVVVDPKQGWHMMLKLVEFQLQHLLDIQTMRRQATLVPKEVHSDFVPRYFASASRDLHRAVDWFIYVKSHEL